MARRKKQQQRREGLLTHLLKWFNLGWVLLTLLAYLSSWVDPDVCWLLAVIGLGFPLYLLGNVAFAIFWLVRRKPYCWFSILTLLAGLHHLGAFIRFPAWHSDKPERAYRVLSYNTAGFRYYFKEAQRSLAPYQQFFEEKKPDIACVQEVYTDDALEAMKAVCGLPHYFKSFGTAVFSRFPIVETGNLQLEPFGSFAAWADVQFPEGIVRVYSVHLKSNQFSHTARELTRHPDPRERRTWAQIQFIFSRYTEFVQVRARQMRILEAHLRSSPRPVLVCGDFNDTPISWIYRRMDEVLLDSFKEAGAGFGFTFASSLPFLRIDYVFADPSFKISDHRVARLRLSDHRPVLVTFALPRRFD